MYDIILFDLDGTLTDPKVGITRSVRYALKKFEIFEDDLDKLEPFIGPPLHHSFMNYYGFSSEDAWKAVSFYREYFSVHGLYENMIYPGIPELLKGLADQARTLAVATSKPTPFAERILEHFNLRSYFDLVAGSNFDGTRVEKGEVIEYALSRLLTGIGQRVLMIGDRKYDVLGAKENGIDSCAVAYGYGSIDELVEARPDYIVSSVDELGKLLMGLK